MAEGVSCQPLNMKAGVQSRTSLCGILGGQTGTGTGYIQVLLFSTVTLIPPMHHAHSFMYHQHSSSNTMHVCAWAYLCVCMHMHARTRSCTRMHTHTHAHPHAHSFTVCLSKNNFNNILNIL